MTSFANRVHDLGLLFAIRCPVACLNCDPAASDGADKSDNQGDHTAHIPVRASCWKSSGLKLALLIRGGGDGEEARTDGDGKNYDSAEDRFVDFLGEAMASDIENCCRPQADHGGPRIARTLSAVKNFEAMLILTSEMANKKRQRR